MRKTSLKRRTPLKSYKPLKAKVGLKRTVMKHKPKRYPISKEESQKVIERSGHNCEYHSICPKHCLGYLELAHIKHRKIGGAQGEFAKIINDHRNIVYLCQWVHNVIDKRILPHPRYDKFRKAIIEDLKQKIGWYEWLEENKEILRGRI